MIDGSVPIGIMDSLTMSGIGMVVVFMELILLAVCINLIGRVIRLVSPKEVPAVAAVAPVAVAPQPAPQPAPQGPKSGVTPPPQLTLMDVDEPTAATVMAVVSHQSGIPLNRLAFHSIKGQVALEGVEERDAAVVMALCAHQLKKPVNKLSFKSIRYVGEAPAVEPAKPAAKKPAPQRTGSAASAPPQRTASTGTVPSPVAKKPAPQRPKSGVTPPAKKPAPQRAKSGVTPPKKTTK